MVSGHAARGGNREVGERSRGVGADTFPCGGSPDEEIDTMTEQMTLGELIMALQKCPPEAICRTGRWGSPTNPHSYRGYYDHLALEVGERKPVAAVLDMLEQACGETYEGYKGGDFTMGSSTPVWLAEQGVSTGDMIVGVYRAVDGIDSEVVIATRNDPYQEMQLVDPYLVEEN